MTSIHSSAPDASAYSRVAFHRGIALRRPQPHEARLLLGQETRVDHRPAELAECFDQTLDRHDRVARFRDLEGRALPDEIVLHVDHEQAGSVDALGNRQIGG